MFVVLDWTELLRVAGKTKWTLYLNYETIGWVTQAHSHTHWKTRTLLHSSSSPLYTAKLSDFPLSILRQLCQCYGATSLKTSVKFADIVAKSVHEKNIFFSGYLSYNEIELAKQFSVYMWGIYSVWEMPLCLERTASQYE